MRTLKQLIFQKNSSRSKVENFLREGLLGIKWLYPCIAAQWKSLLVCDVKIFNNSVYSKIFSLKQ